MAALRFSLFFLLSLFSFGCGLPDTKDKKSVTTTGAGYSPPVSALSTKKVKIVNDPPRPVAASQTDSSKGSTLKLRSSPANFSGPPHFIQLKGECYSAQTTKYRFDVCPFDNVTQTDISTSWNPYKGVLGVWAGWEIVNETFVALIFKDGDSCGAKKRMTRVVLICGKDALADNPREPHTCEYEVTLAHPVVCNDGVSVFLALENEGRNKLVALQNELFDEEITPQGYQRQTHALYVEAGLIAPESAHVPSPPPPPVVSNAYNHKARGNSYNQQLSGKTSNVHDTKKEDDAKKCETEKHDLQNTIDELRGTIKNLSAILHTLQPDVYPDPAKVSLTPAQKAAKPASMNNPTSKKIVNKHVELENDPPLPKDEDHKVLSIERKNAVPAAEGKNEEPDEKINVEANGEAHELNVKHLLQEQKQRAKSRNQEDQHKEAEVQEPLPSQAPLKPKDADEEEEHTAPVAKARTRVPPVQKSSSSTSSTKRSSAPTSKKKSQTTKKTTPKPKKPLQERDGEDEEE